MAVHRSAFVLLKRAAAAASASVTPAPVHARALLVGPPVAAASALVPASVTPAAGGVGKWLLHARGWLCCRVSSVSGASSDCRCRLGTCPRSCVSIGARGGSLRLVCATVSCCLLRLLAILLLLLLLLRGMYVLAAAPPPAPSLTAPAAVVCTNPPAIPAAASSILLRPTLDTWLCQHQLRRHTSGGVSSYLQRRSACSLP